MTPDATLFATTRCLCLAARRAARTITREFDQALRPQGLRATQFTLLSALHLAGSTAIGELAELLSADRTTLTRTLAVAAERGWVSLRSNPADARSRFVAITAKGSRALVAAMPAWNATQQRLLQDIGESAAASLHRLAGGPCVMPLPAGVAPDKPTSRRRNTRTLENG